MQIFTYVAIGAIGDKYSLSAGIMKEVDHAAATRTVLDAFFDRYGFRPTRVEVAGVSAFTVRQMAIEVGEIEE